MKQYKITKSPISKLREYYFTNKRMPSYAELAEMLGFKSKWGAQRLVVKWVREGIICKDSNGKLIPGKFLNPLKVLGTVTAGVPSAAEEENVHTISLDDWLIQNKESTFMLKVSGDSMIEAAIMPGDLVILERSKEPKNGDVVVAEVDREWTIKYFFKFDSQTILKPANKKYESIIPKEELRIAGVVTAVIRKFSS